MMCALCARRNHIRRSQEKATYEEVRQLVATHYDAWYLIREWHLRSEATSMSVDTMLVHAHVGACGAAPYKEAMIAVELDGTSHGGIPCLFGQERWAAMQAQKERDDAKDAALRRKGITAVRIKYKDPDGIAQLAVAMKEVARMHHRSTMYCALTKITL